MGFFSLLLNCKISFQMKEKKKILSTNLFPFSIDSWFPPPSTFPVFWNKMWFQTKNIKTCHSKPVDFQNTAFFSPVKLSCQINIISACCTHRITQFQGTVFQCKSFAKRYFNEVQTRCMAQATRLVQRWDSVRTVKEITNQSVGLVFLISLVGICWYRNN